MKVLAVVETEDTDETKAVSGGRVVGRVAEFLEGAADAVDWAATTEADGRSRWSRRWSMR